ncbi:MAG TPA: C13 family peptidase [Noviherbaspirillum sp.]
MTSTTASPVRKPASASSFLNWYSEAGRAALFLRPRWDRVDASPARLALLVLILVLLAIVLDRIAIGVGEAVHFNWRALGQDWLPVLTTIWACYLVRPKPAYDPDRRIAPGAAHLAGMALALSFVTTLVASLVYLGLESSGIGDLMLWSVWRLTFLWSVIAEIVLVTRSGTRHSGARLLAAAVLLISSLFYLALPQTHFWHAPRPDHAEQRPTLELTQQLMEAQPALLARRLEALPPQRPGVVDLYALTFAPYSDEDVFRNESAMVSEVMAQRFGAHHLQLVNHVDTVEQWPWATPLNLRRAIQAAAARMDPNEDVLFLHLTSHGARNGVLAAEFWPMTVESVTPSALKAWLDEAGVRYRILSISACYSGSWIAPLAADNTLVMTAADADHTSYGCGRGSELTFFGRALYNEQLREHTLSFEQAHATARELIKQREEEAGKSDGYSNPQIAVGNGIRKKLEQLRAAQEPGTT